MGGRERVAGGLRVDRGHRGRVWEGVLCSVTHSRSRSRSLRLVAGHFSSVWILMRRCR